MQSSELQKYLTESLQNRGTTNVNTSTHSSNIEVVKYDYNRILEVKPKGISKGIHAYASIHNISLCPHGKNVYVMLVHVAVQELLQRIYYKPC